MSSLRTMGVLLAAGGGTRFRAADGSHKLLAELRGIPLWRHSLDHLLAAGFDAIVVGLADQPFVPPEAWRAVADAPTECRLVVATYAGEWGPNPVRIASSLWPELPTDGDEGARSLLRRLRDDVCTVACVGSAADIDTPEDLARWTSS